MANTVPGRRVEKAQRTIHDVRVQLSGPDATPAPVHIQQGRIAQHEQRHAFKHAKLDHLQCGCAHGRPGVCSFEDRAPRLPRAPLTALRSTPRRSASAAMRHLQARRQLVAGRRGALFPRGVPVPPPPPSAPRHPRVPVPRRCAARRRRAFQSRARAATARPPARGTRGMPSAGCPVLSEGLVAAPGHGSRSRSACRRGWVCRCVG